MLILVVMIGLVMDMISLARHVRVIAVRGASVFMYVIAMFVHVALMFMRVPVPLVRVAVVRIPLPALLQMHVKIKRIQPALLRPSKVQMISSDAQTFQRALQLPAVRAQIKERAHGHVAADSRIAFQI